MVGRRGGVGNFPGGSPGPLDVGESPNRQETEMRPMSLQGRQAVPLDFECPKCGALRGHGCESLKGLRTMTHAARKAVMANHNALKVNGGWVDAE